MANNNIDGSDDKLYLNHYRCIDCDIVWEDEWNCMCNDRCPKCDAEIEPFKSDEIVTLERD